MGSCGNRRKHTCSGKINSVCVKYDGNIPDWSELKEEDCVVVEETIEDLYDNIDKIKKDIDTSELGKACIEYPKDDKGKIAVKDVLLKFEEKLCEVSGESGGGDCCDISKIDTKCLTDECGVKPKNLQELLQIMIDEICKLKKLMN